MNDTITRANLENVLQSLANLTGDETYLNYADSIEDGTDLLDHVSNAMSEASKLLEREADKLEGF